jgi:hypothetical protein
MLFSFCSSRLALPAFLLLASTLLAGCVTDQSAPVASTVAPVPRGQAGITVTRTGGYYALAVAADIDANGVKLARLDRGETFSGSVPPGPVTLSVSCWCGPGRYSVRFNAQAGQRYAFEVTPRDEQFVATFAGGLVGAAVDAAVNGESSGSFKIAEVPNSR